MGTICKSGQCGLRAVVYRLSCAGSVNGISRQIANTPSSFLGAPPGLGYTRASVCIFPLPFTSELSRGAISDLRSSLLKYRELEPLEPVSEILRLMAASVLAPEVDDTARGSLWPLGQFAESATGVVI